MVSRSAPPRWLMVALMGCLCILLIFALTRPDMAGQGAEAAVVPTEGVVLTPTPTPASTPEPTPEPTPTPEPRPEYPTELPDPNDPESPDTITIYEEGVPKTYIKMFDPETNEYVYILDEEVPLFGPLENPQTGDSGQPALFGTVCLAALLALLALLRKPGPNRK